jgi:hypothetical protein
LNTTPRDESGWTIETYSAHNEALRQAEEKFQNERDRRYAEVDVEREKALKIKETADETARVLVAENQAYRDEKANELRSQIERERGMYVQRSDLEGAMGKTEATLAPLVAFAASQQGRREGVGTITAIVYGVLVILIALISTSVLLLTRHNTGPPAVITVTVPSK